MATSGPTSSAFISSTSVPEGFHYETKFIVLSFLGLPPLNKAVTESQVERTAVIREQVAEALSKLEAEIADSSSGFDRLTSPVLSPATPDTIEDTLADLGDKVARDLDAHLPAAVHALLTCDPGQLHDGFRQTVVDLSTYTRESWSKVLVPLVLLQALQHEGQPVPSLLHLGVQFLEEEAEDIIQRGGWGEIFARHSEVEPSDPIAEDSNDIYILSADPHLDRLSPEPASLLCEGDSSLQSSWQTESLPVSLAGHESWAQIGGMDPDDYKSVDSAEGAALAEERSENNSSNSDIVHVEREELLDEGGEAVEESMMSVLGSESEMAELREQFNTQIPPVPAPADAAEAASLVSIDEPVVIETPVSLTSEPSIITLSEEPSLVSLEPELPSAAPEVAPSPPEPEPEPAAPSPVPAAEPEGEIAAVTAEVTLQSEPPVTSSAAEPETISEPEPTPEPEPPHVPPESELDAQLEPRSAPVTADPPAQPPVLEPAQTESLCELPALIYGGAALVALAGVVVYGVISYRRK